MSIEFKILDEIQSMLDKALDKAAKAYLDSCEKTGIDKMDDDDIRCLLKLRKTEKKFQQIDTINEFLSKHGLIDKNNQWLSLPTGSNTKDCLIVRFKAWERSLS